MKKFLLAVFCAAIFGCNAQNIDAIKGNTYVLVDSPEGLEITISFDAEVSRFHGKAVNGYFGNYQVEGSNLTVMPIASTMMAAPEPLMKAETSYFQSLQNMKKISVKGDILVLSNDNQKLIFEKLVPVTEVEVEEVVENTEVVE